MKLWMGADTHVYKYSAAMTLLMFMNNNSISADDLWFSISISVRNNSCCADLFHVYLLVLTATVCGIQFFENLVMLFIWMNSLTFHIKHWCVRAWICETRKQVVALCVYINCLYDFFVNNVESDIERIWAYKSLLFCYFHFYLFKNYYFFFFSTLVSCTSLTFPPYWPHNFLYWSS